MKLTTGTMKNLKKVVIGNQTFMGFFENKIVDAVGTGDVTTYVQKAYLGETQDITIGLNSGYSVSDLNEEEEIKIRTMLENLKIAESRAVKQLTLDYLSKNFR